MKGTEQKKGKALRHHIKTHAYYMD